VSARAGAADRARDPGPTFPPGESGLEDSTRPTTRLPPSTGKRSSPAERADRVPVGLPRGRPTRSTAGVELFGRLDGEADAEQVQRRHGPAVQPLRVGGAAGRCNSAR
jgi:hypothetical protein